MAIIDPRQQQLSPGYRSRLTEQIGFLRALPANEDLPSVHCFALNWPDPDQPCGVFIVDERLFEGASLSTNDGDDYFGLKLALGPIAVVLLDTNINMENAYLEWRQRWQRTYLALPSADEIEKKWQAEPNRERIRSIKEEMERLRADLVERGATAAREMSDAQLAAASERVAWNLRTSGRMSRVPHAEWRTLWLDEFADNLRESAA